jgi:hypothetical protein
MPELVMNTVATITTGRKSAWSTRLGVTLLVAAGLSAIAASPAAADDDNWVFRRSYFSHVLPPEIQARYPVPESRSAYRLPLVDIYPGVSVQGVYRYNTIQLGNGPNGTDTTIYRQYWLQVKP